MQIISRYAVRECRSHYEAETRRKALGQALIDLIQSGVIDRAVGKIDFYCGGGTPIATLEISEDADKL